jgi:hypothetical protein
MSLWMVVGAWLLSKYFQVVVMLWLYTSTPIPPPRENDDLGIPYIKLKLLKIGFLCHNPIGIIDYALELLYTRIREKTKYVSFLSFVPSRDDYYVVYMWFATHYFHLHSYQIHSIPTWLIYVILRGLEFSCTFIVLKISSWEGSRASCPAAVNCQNQR